MVKIKFNVLVGLLLVLAIATILININSNSIKTTQIGTQQFSPANQVNSLDTNVGLLHYSCSNSCLQGNCQKAESYQGVNKNYYCICSQCDSVNKCILTSKVRNNFIWTC